MTEEEGFPVSRLQERYGLGEYQSVINRYKLLGIAPFKRGRQSFITETQLKALDELNEWKKKNPSVKLSEYPGAVAAAPSGGSLAVVDVDSAEIARATEGEISLTIHELTQLVKSIRPIEPLAHLKELERAAASGWLLTTAEVKQLIGVLPKGELFSRGSFSFQKSGKIGSSTAWRVIKVVPGNS